MEAKNKRDGEASAQRGINGLRLTQPQNLEDEWQIEETTGKGLPLGGGGVPLKMGGNWKWKWRHNKRKSEMHRVLGGGVVFSTTTVDPKMAAINGKTPQGSSAGPWRAGLLFRPEVDKSKQSAT